MENLIVIDKLEDLIKLEKHINEHEFLAYDTETDGVLKSSRIIGFSVAGTIEEAYYVILSYWDVAQQKMIDLPTKAEAARILSLLAKKHTIMHNAIFDCQMTKNNFGVDLLPSLHTDTMILGHLLDENRSNGLKELGTSIFGEDATKEQLEMKESISKNGGLLTKEKYELYKGDAHLIGKYGAKDTILTLKLFYHFVPQLIEEGLDKFFYDEESMPLLKSSTYELNTIGLKVDQTKLQNLKGTLEVEIQELKASIYQEVNPIVTVRGYKGTKPSNTFNINANNQLSWLLFEVLANEFNTLTKAGKELAKALQIPIPYSPKAKREFIHVVKQNKDKVWEEAKYSKKTKKMGKPKKVGEYWKYIACGKETLKKLENKYKWVADLLKYKKSSKLLDTYVLGIMEKTQYGIIQPSFLQHGTTSGRYSSKSPNFQNLPRDDKRIKACIISRPGKVFVGADQSQLEPRVFASFSNDKRLQECFSSGDDFYSVIGIETFDKFDATPKKEGSQEAFGIKYKKLRDISKAVALSATYGTTAFKMGPLIGKSSEEAQEVIDSYFEKFPSVKELMLESHKIAIQHGKVVNLFGRPRRMSKAQMIPEIFGNTAHEGLPYEWRNILNLAVNHRIQSTGASIMNRSAIAFSNKIKAAGIKDCHIVLQVHDELVAECLEKDATQVAEILKDSMENTVVLPGVKLEAIPNIANNLADLK